MASTDLATAREILQDPQATGEDLATAAQGLFGAFQRAEHLIGLLDPDAPEVLTRVLGRGVDAQDLDAIRLLAWVRLGREPMLNGVIDPDVDEALALFRMAADRGSRDDVVQFVRVAHFSESPAIASWHSEAAGRLNQLLATDPDPELLVLAAWMLQAGHGYAQDVARARQMLTAAAERGSADAHFELYVYDSRGMAGPVDPAAALAHLRAAAEGGNTRAMANLGGMYATGNGVPVDEAESVRWYRLAADAGHARAAHTLSVMYARGEGAPQDRELAEHYAQLAEELGG